MSYQPTDSEILEAVQLLTKLADVDHSDNNLKRLLDADCKFKKFLADFAELDQHIHAIYDKEYDYNQTLSTFIEAKIGDDILEYASHWLMLCKLIKHRRVLIALVRQDGDDTIDENDGVQITIDLTKSDTEDKTFTDIIAELTAKLKSR